MGHKMSIPIIRFRAPGILCKAKPYGDDMMCTRCKFLWAIGHKDPPRCLTADQLHNDPMKPILAKIAASHRIEGKA